MAAVMVVVVVEADGYYISFGGYDGDGGGGV